MKLVGYIQAACGGEASSARRGKCAGGHNRVRRSGRGASAVLPRFREDMNGPLVTVFRMTTG